MTFQAHANAILNLLDADNGPPPLVFYDGFVPAGSAAPYVVCYFAFDAPEPSQDTQSSTLTMVTNRVDCFVYCHCVGANGIASRAVAARVRSALLDIEPAVSGRSAFPIRLIQSQPAQRDETTGVLVIDTVDLYRLSTVPG